MLDARTPWKFYAPPHAAMAITLMAAPKLHLAKVVLALGGGPNQALHAHRWKYVLTPGISGAIVLLIIAFLKIQIMKVVRKAVAPAKES